MSRPIQIFRQCCLAVAAAGVVALLAGLALGQPGLWRAAAVVTAASLPIGIGAIPALRGYQFTLWIIAAVTAAMIYPAAFLRWGELDLRNKYLVLVVVQLVMFGMGTQMSVRDFAGVARMPRGVIVGIVGQFTIMPLVGFGLTKLFRFPPEIAAGIVLIGSCSSGLASNVMTYLARANLALSVTLTTFATLLAPLMTPLWMKLLAGAYIRVDFVAMMVEIVKIVLVPVGAAMLHDYLKFAAPGPRGVIYIAGATGAIYVSLLGTGLLTGTAGATLTTMLTLLGFLFGAVIVGIAYHHLTRWVTWLDSVMPAVSMFGIIYFTAVTTAAGRDNLLAVGGLLFVAAMMHNGFGYLFGYLGARISGLSRTDARTVAIEVGLQNGGMAAGIAASLGKLGTLGLAAAIFSPWMNVSGSILANYWRRRPVDAHAAESDVPVQPPEPIATVRPA